MAKRKRLELPSEADTAVLETKSAFSGMSRMPIAEVAGDTAVRAALEEVSGAMAAAEAEGRMVRKLPLDRIEAALDAARHRGSALVEGARSRDFRPVPLNVTTSIEFSNDVRSTSSATHRAQGSRAQYDSSSSAVPSGSSGETTMASRASEPIFTAAA